MGWREAEWSFSRSPDKTIPIFLRFNLLFNNPFVHSSVMMRKSALDQVGGYTTDPARQPPEDYELWSRISRHYRVANLPERLTIYRGSSFQHVPGECATVSTETCHDLFGKPGTCDRSHGAAADSHRHRRAYSWRGDATSRLLNVKRMCAVVADAGNRIRWRPTRRGARSKNLEHADSTPSASCCASRNMAWFGARHAPCAAVCAV